MREVFTCTYLTNINAGHILQLRASTTRMLRRRPGCGGGLVLDVPGACNLTQAAALLPDFPLHSLQWTIESCS